MPKRSRKKAPPDEPFLVAAKELFQFLEDTYGYIVTDVSSCSTWAAVEYENAGIRAGVTVGFERRDGWLYVRFAHIDPDATGRQRIRRSYYLGNILALRNPEAEATLSKHLVTRTVEEITDELSKLAAYTVLYAGDVLRGDFQAFDALDLVRR